MEKFLLKKLNKHNTRYLRYDNAGENQKLSDLCDRYGVEIEYTAPNTSQQNGVAERDFAVIRQRAVAMMHDLDLDKEIKKSSVGRSTIHSNCANEHHYECFIR